jgi:ATP-binding cassette, subfamily B, bacterial
MNVQSFIFLFGIIIAVGFGISYLSGRRKKPFPSILESRPDENGPVCLQMVALHYGKHYTISYLLRTTSLQKKTSVLSNLREAAEIAGFNASITELDFEALERLHQFPVIIRWQENRFAVLYAIKNDTCFIADTIMGKIEVSADVFCKQWYEGESAKGTVLLLQPGKNVTEDAG